MARGRGRRDRSRERMIAFWEAQDRVAERGSPGSDPSSGFSDTGNNAADDVSNRSGSGYSQGDASTETGASSSDASAAWHSARDDYEADEGLGDRHDGGWQR